MLQTFSPASIQELIEAFDFKEHSDIDKLVRRFDLHDGDGSGGIKKREASITDYLLDNQDLTVRDGRNLVLAVLGYLLHEREKRNQMLRRGFDPAEEFPDLAESLEADGITIVDASNVTMSSPQRHANPSVDVNVTSLSKDIKMTQPNRSTVFVIHGRNSEFRDAIFDFLRAIGLRPLEFEVAKVRTGKGAPYVGEVLDYAFATAHAVLVLLTGDDEARLVESMREGGDPRFETELTPQARPNVLFEAGMAIGRNPERTVLIEFGRLRPFSDVAGRHIFRFIDSPEKRKELAEHLRALGCAVELDGTGLLRAGRFPKNP